MNNISDLSVISKKASIGNNVSIGPFCVIGDDVILEDNVSLQSHVVITGKTRVGAGTAIFPYASIGQDPQDLKFKGEDAEVIIGKNNVIREYVTIQKGTESGGMKTVIGDNNLLMVGTHIAHDCLVGNNVIFANVATLAGHVVIEDHVVIGGLSAVHQYVRIGEHAMIGGCTAVIRDVVPFATVTSERSGISGINLLGLKRRGFQREDITQLQKAFDEIFFENNTDLKTALEKVKSQNNSETVSILIKFLESESKRSFTMSARKEDR